jgi:DNA-binding XRE family transcriptional regulator
MDEFNKLIAEISERLKKLDALSKGDRKKEMQAYAIKLKFYREKNKLTQAELAKKLGVDVMAIIRWEAARVMPSQLSILRFKELGILDK